MRIQGFNQSSQMQAGSFKFSKRGQEQLNTPEEITADLEKNGLRMSQNNVKFQLEKAMNQSSKFIHKELGKIFDNGEQLLAGRNTAEYQKHIDELSKAIQGQDFKTAEKLIDKFYNGDTETIINRVQNLAKAAENNFWQTMEDSFGYLKNDGLKWTMFVDGKLRDDLGTFDLAMMAIEEARNEVEKFSSEELGDIVKATRDGAVAYAKGKLKDAGQNQYSETAYSVTNAATTYAKGKIFNTDDSNYEEDETKLKDINELRSDQNITEEQLDRLTHQNTRKGDRFTEYMRGRADSFEEKFYDLQLSGTPRTVKQATNQVQNDPASANQNHHFLAIVNKPLLRPIEDSISESSQLQQQNDLAKIAKYTAFSTEDLLSSIDWKI
ncbi:hypothetical protein [Maridesulfovibrio sp.]|uniref:hypothetical protein n=1 Tax=Maridesulfovibrio sp. TaxID=2795000 RepID=UPI002A187F3A|nr:hypothetical protein [Maridesulfovibrio sp.]